uniref:Peptidase C1A papain C-terminal domain-containing protein n=1 Tax=Pavo cristatus TaxID=9049 RepID=A0A8C9FVF6_PAVCR
GSRQPKAGAQEKALRGAPGCAACGGGALVGPPLGARSTPRESRCLRRTPGAPSGNPSAAEPLLGAKIPRENRSAAGGGARGCLYGPSARAPAVGQPCSSPADAVQGQGHTHGPSSPPLVLVGRGTPTLRQTGRGAQSFYRALSSAPTFRGSPPPPAELRTTAGTGEGALGAVASNSFGAGWGSSARPLPRDTPGTSPCPLLPPGRGYKGAAGPEEALGSGGSGERCTSGRQRLRLRGHGQHRARALGAALAAGGGGFGRPGADAPGVVPGFVRARGVRCRRVLLPARGCLLPRARRRLHRALPRHHLLLRPLLQPHRLRLLPRFLGVLPGHPGPVPESSSTCSPGGQWQCEEHACLMDGDLIDAVNRGNYGWRAANYSQFWGMTLEDGMRYRLGTFRPPPTVMNMNEMHMAMDSNEVLPRHFDAATKWPGMIHEPLDQGNCAGSWAFSTAAVASDRISIHSMGHMTPSLSPQNLLSCDTRNQRGCSGGRLDGAWWYLRRRGVVTDECYPFTSQESQPAAQPCMMHSRSTGRGKRQATARCPNPQTHANQIYQSTPAYRLAPSEKEIMKELMENGPVQAILEVHEDFFLYKSGIYRHTPVAEGKGPKHQQHGTHSVKITGWGEEQLPDGQIQKYWVSAAVMSSAGLGLLG